MKIGDDFKYQGSLETIVCIQGDKVISDNGSSQTDWDYRTVELIMENQVGYA